MELKETKDILEKIRGVKVAVYGDFCLDAYWILDPGGSESSIETGLRGEAVKKQYYSLGGASNIVANLAALNASRINAIGIIGDDIFGREIKKQFEELGICTQYLITQKDNFSTVTFGKRILNGREKARIDFGFFNKRSEYSDNIIIKGLEEAIKSSDVLIFNQQVPGSITSKDFLNKINDLFSRNSDKIIILDSRHYSGDIRNAYIKINLNEAKRLSHPGLNISDLKDSGNIKIMSENLYKIFKKPIFITNGNHGIVIFDSNGFYDVPGVQLSGKLDPVGAGDTVTASIALCLGAGIDNYTAITFANLAAAVVVKKLYQTGTASPEEVLEISKERKNEQKGWIVFI